MPETFFMKKTSPSKSCSCSLRKNAKFTDVYNEKFGSTLFGQVDILILLEHKEAQYIIEPFLNICYAKLHTKNIKYVVCYALGCVTKNYIIPNTKTIYATCKKYNIKKIIESHSPKVIIAVGRALYTITGYRGLTTAESTQQRAAGGHFYALHEDDVWIYSKEFSCKVYPIPPLYQFICLDNYERQFALKQFDRAVTALSEKPKRVQKSQFFEVEDPNTLLKELISSQTITEIAIDTETSGKNYFKNKLVSIQISYDGATGFFLDFSKINKDLLIEFFASNKKFIFHNMQFDLHFLIANGIYNAHGYFDTMLAAHILNENSPNGLKDLAWLYTTEGGYDDELAAYVLEKNIKDFSLIPKHILVKYACYDVIITFRLYKYFEKRLKEEEEEGEDEQGPTVAYNFYKFTIPIARMFTEVEMTGVQLDLKYLDEYCKNLQIKAKVIENEIYGIAGREFNIKSNKQLSEVLKSLTNFEVAKDVDGIELVTKTGDLQVNKKALNLYAESGITFAKQIIEYNHIMKELSQFGLTTKTKQTSESSRTLFSIDSSEDDSEAPEESVGFLASVYNGRLYGGYKIHGTRTGRVSGGGGLNSTVNYQNFQKTEEFRKIFIPSRGFIFCELDYSAMEVVCGSQISGKGPLENLVLEGKDMHAYTAEKVVKAIGVTALAFYLWDTFSKNLELVKQYESIKSAAGLANYLSKFDLTYESIKNLSKGENKNEIIKLLREEIKGVNFACLYGSSAFGLSKALHVDVKLAEKFLTAFYEAYPEFEAYMIEYRTHAEKYGWNKTLLGRKRRFPKLMYKKVEFLNQFYKNNVMVYNTKKELTSIITNLYNACINSPIQGVAGQQTLIAMVKMYEEFKKRNMKSRLLITVHDSIVAEFYISEFDEALEIFKRCALTQYYKNRKGNKVQLKADFKCGGIWGYGKPIEYWKEHPKEWDLMLKNLEKRHDELETYMRKNRK